MPDILRIESNGTSDSYFGKVISFIHAKKLIDRGYLCYLAFIWDINVESPPMKYIFVVKGFADVFSIYLSIIPSDRNIDFVIDSELSIKPISILPYYDSGEGKTARLFVK